MHFKKSLDNFGFAVLTTETRLYYPSRGIDKRIKQ